MLTCSMRLGLAPFAVTHCFKIAFRVVKLFYKMHVHTLQFCFFITALRLVFLNLYESLLILHMQSIDKAAGLVFEHMSAVDKHHG